MKKILTLLLVILMILPMAGCAKKKAYESALDAYNANDFYTALPSFVEAGDYEDAASMALKCRIAITEATLENDDYASLTELIKEWPADQYEELIPYVNSKLKKVFTLYSLESSSMDMIEDIKQLLLALGEEEGSDRVATLQDILNHKELLETWYTYLAIDSLYHSSVIKNVNALYEAITAVDEVSILNTIAPKFASIADDITTKLGTKNEKIKSYVDNLYLAAEALQNEVIAVKNNTDSTKYYEQRIEAFTNIDALVDGYKEYKNYKSSIQSALRTYFK